jgi:hypothetical protein
MENKLLKLFLELNVKLDSVKVPLFESDLTYYELRKFLTIMFKNIRDTDTKKILGEILKILTVMELKKQTVPTVKKLRSTSPNIFGDN